MIYIMCCCSTRLLRSHSVSLDMLDAVPSRKILDRGNIRFAPKDRPSNSCRPPGSAIPVQLTKASCRVGSRARRRVPFAIGRGDYRPRLLAWFCQQSSGVATPRTLRARWGSPIGRRRAQHRADNSALCRRDVDLRLVRAVQRYRPCPHRPGGQRRCA